MAAKKKSVKKPAKKDVKKAAKKDAKAAKGKAAKPAATAGKAAPKPQVVAPRAGPKVGDRAPDFTLPTDSGPISLAALRGKPVVVYFYPKDDTPGCTREACTFNDNLPNFGALNAEIIGISKDAEASHARFREKYGLKFHLASDADTKVQKAYGVWVEKMNYGRSYMGTERSTFLVDKDGVIRAAWRGVKVDGHVEKVLEAAKAL
jgi:peroxiredoxin Q/BCP